MLIIEKGCDKLPKALNGIKPVLIYPLGGLAVVAIMMCAVNPIMYVVVLAVGSVIGMLLLGLFKKKVTE